MSAYTPNLCAVGLITKGRREEYRTSVVVVKQKIIAICDNINNFPTDERLTEEMGRLEKIIREKLVESFKNGLEAGQKKRKNSARK